MGPELLTWYTPADGVTDLLKQSKAWLHVDCTYWVAVQCPAVISTRYLMPYSLTCILDLLNFFQAACYCWGSKLRLSRGQGIILTSFLTSLSSLTLLRQQSTQAPGCFNLGKRILVPPPFFYVFKVRYRVSIEAQKNIKSECFVKNSPSSYNLITRGYSMHIL